MPEDLRFQRLRVPASERELTDLERAQLDLVGERFGYDLGDADDRLAPGQLFESGFELWDVVTVDRERTVATAFGTGLDMILFVADSTELFGSAIQHVYGGYDDDMTAALARAEQPEERGFVLPSIDFPVPSTADRPLPVGARRLDWANIFLRDPTAPVGGRRDGTPWPPFRATGVPSKIRAVAFGTNAESHDAAHMLGYALTGPDAVAAAGAIDLLGATLREADHPGVVVHLAVKILDAHDAAAARDALIDASRPYREALRELTGRAKAAAERWVHAAG